MPKVCSFFTLHKNVFMGQGRLLGNFAGTATLNSNNLTVYAAESTMYYSVEPWLFLTVINQQQGLSIFTPKWMGVSYINSMTNSDMTIIEFIKDVQIRDAWAIGHSAPLNDTEWNPNPGAYDIVKVNGGYDASTYMIASYCRKYSTGDLNRDSVLTAGNNTFCFVSGESTAMNRTTSSHTSLSCINFTLATTMTGTFRDPAKNNSQGVINYTSPTNNVQVQSWSLRAATYLVLLLVIVA
jgi:hypothetical protein